MNNQTPSSSGASTPRPKIEAHNLSVRFPTKGGLVTALESVELEVRENEFLCIMGPSGCGKTTLLNVIAGMVPKTEGTIRISDRDIAKPGPDRAVVFQADAVFPWMTVEQNVAFGPQVQGKPAGEVKAITDRFIDLVHLSDFRKSWPRQLSGGMRKRVDIARAYAADPEVLLLDEPFGPLDIMTKEYLQAELRSLWSVEPRTVIFITHDIEEALFLGDRIVVMTPRPGKIHKIYEPGFPRDRDMSLKLTPEFVEYRRQVHEIFKHDIHL